MKNQYHHPILPIIFVALALINCSMERKAEVKPAKSNTLILQYQDFGPQVISHEMIGYEWYQWNSQGPDDPNASDDVKVVVYRNISLDEVKRLYPVVERRQDYRYLEYKAALDLLGKYEIDPFWNEHPETREKMRQTRQRILEQLGT